MPTQSTGEQGPRAVVPAGEKASTGTPSGPKPCAKECAADGRCSEAAACQGTSPESELCALKQQIHALTGQASMAEVASTALHNVGNVLNSVNVAATLVAQRLRESRVQNFGKALEMLRQHRADVARFLTEDSKGRMLPAYLETLAEHLLAEHAQMLEEMEVLNRGLEHMRAVVTVQQSYARTCGAIETLPPAELVEDALTMNRAAFERHGVDIVREFADTPPITVDKHKVLQILVNLIRNAKYSMDERNGPEKILTLRIGSENSHSVAIQVCDTGMGIARENLPRIFEHGFTTKRDGHGVGLYSGTIAARELGGTLTVQSEGLGKGATFCLELPVKHKPTEQSENAGGNSKLEI